MNNPEHSDFGYFSDDGEKLNPNFIKKPSLCTTCINDYDPTQEILCDLTRLDQQDEEHFHCEAYKQMK
jgi:hypothetical protein